MSDKIKIPAGTRLKNLGSGRVEQLQDELEIVAEHRLEDDTWVFLQNGNVYEVKLNPGD